MVEPRRCWWMHLHKGPTRSCQKKLSGRPRETVSPTRPTGPTGIFICGMHRSSLEQANGCETRARQASRTKSPATCVAQNHDTTLARPSPAPFQADPAKKGWTSVPDHGLCSGHQQIAAMPAGMGAWKSGNTLTHGEPGTPGYLPSLLGLLVRFLSTHAATFHSPPAGSRPGAPNYSRLRPAPGTAGLTIAVGEHGSIENQSRRWRRIPPASTVGPTRLRRLLVGT